VSPCVPPQRLVLVHGRYSYYRTSVVAQYSFYKSFLFCFLQVRVSLCQCVSLSVVSVSVSVLVYDLSVSPCISSVSVCLPVSPGFVVW
jgi:magnesium-transporting ATPase (P-type)